MKKLIIKIGNETHELPYNDEVFSFEVSDKYVPKVGDCVRVIENDFSYESVFKIVSIRNDGRIKSENSVDLKSGKYIIDLEDYLFFANREFTQITTEELKAKYAEAGYDWDYETNEVKPIKWMPKVGDYVWYLNLFFNPAKVDFDNDIKLKLMLEKGLLFPTESECQKFADHCLKYFDKK